MDKKLNLNIEKKLCSYQLIQMENNLKKKTEEKTFFDHKRKKKKPTE